MTRIILTHCHIDHVGGAPQIKKQLGSKIYIHKLDAFPVENGDPILTAAAWYQTTFAPTPVDVKLVLPKEELIVGGEKTVCLHTPGTPGSISIYLDRNGKRVLFGQDLHGPLLQEFGSNLSDWDKSTQKLLNLEADILCEGHFGTYTTKNAVREVIRPTAVTMGLVDPIGTLTGVERLNRAWLLVLNHYL